MREASTHPPAHPFTIDEPPLNPLIVALRHLSESLWASAKTVSLTGSCCDADISNQLTEPETSGEGFTKDVTTMSRKKIKWYQVLWELLVHTITGLAYFCAMAGAAFIIIKVNEWLMAHGVDGFTMTMLHVAEVLFVLFDFYAVCRYIYQRVREDH